ncbi:hypothetical protein LJC04_01210 [Ruminococcaceae bacterium OttesenSCG-928-O06]|nr:hypothetical protein [Ruminococcaceae bacterium OttesenSCG-928-O06]
MPLSYEQQFTAFYFECDLWDRMAPGAVLRRVQEISTAQCDALGINEALYRRTGTVFLLAKLSLQVQRMPRLLEDVRIETRAYGMKRAVYQRMTSLHNAQTGEKLCETDARWILVDTETRRIRRKPLDEFLPLFNEEPGAEGHNMDIVRPKTLYPIKEMRATYTLCDRNGHVNNTKYADIVCDHLPIEQLRAAVPKRMLLWYHSEIPLSSSFSLAGAPSGENGYYFVAAQQDRKNFECQIEF